METACVISQSYLPQQPLNHERPDVPLPATSFIHVHNKTTTTTTATATTKFGHQRNLSLDFRSMGIILPPLSATIQSHT